MKPTIVILSLILLCHSQVGKADMVGPSATLHAFSPDGNLVVRISAAVPTNAAVPTDKAQKMPSYEVSYYKYDSAKDTYVRHSSFHLIGYLSQMLYVSNAGDLVMISLGERGAIRLYSKEGKLTKSWSLKGFLTDAEIVACAQTGSTLQWFDQGAFYGRHFYLRGPSCIIRALQPSYTVMRGRNDKVTFSATIDTETLKLTKHDPEEP